MPPGQCEEGGHRQQEEQRFGIPPDQHEGGWEAGRQPHGTTGQTTVARHLADQAQEEGHGHQGRDVGDEEQRRSCSAGKYHIEEAAEEHETRKEADALRRRTRIARLDERPVPGTVPGEESLPDLEGPVPVVQVVDVEADAQHRSGHQ